MSVPAASSFVIWRLAFGDFRFYLFRCLVCATFIAVAVLPCCRDAEWGVVFRGAADEELRYCVLLQLIWVLLERRMALVGLPNGPTGAD